MMTDDIARLSDRLFALLANYCSGRHWLHGQAVEDTANTARHPDSVCLSNQLSIDSPGQSTRRILKVPVYKVPPPTTIPDPIPGFRRPSAGLHLQVQVPKGLLGYRPSL